MAEVIRKFEVNGTKFLVDMRNGDYAPESSNENTIFVINNVLPVSNVHNVNYINGDFIVNLESKGEEKIIIVNYIKATKTFNVPGYDPRLIIKSILESPKFKYLFSHEQQCRRLMPPDSPISDEDNEYSLNVYNTRPRSNRNHGYNIMELLNDPRMVMMIRRIVNEEVKKAVLNIPLNINISPPVIPSRTPNIVPADGIMEDVEIDDLVSTFM